jgi:hypothetical protein
MSRNCVFQAMAPESVVISDFVRLCTAEGLKPSEAYKEAKKRFQPIKKPRNSGIA